MITSASAPQGGTGWVRAVWRERHRALLSTHLAHAAVACGGGSAGLGAAFDLLLELASEGRRVEPSRASEENGWQAFKPVKETKAKVSSL
jgi:hypothetical protein